MNLFGGLSTGALFAMAAICGAGASQGPSKEAELLSDSELVYESSGGIAGVVRSAKLVARAGQVTAEYSAKEGRSIVGPQNGPLEPSAYLELWREAERLQIWTLEVPAKAKGADEMQHEMRVRVGERRHAVSWSGSDRPSPSEQNAVLIGQRILALARDAAALR
jgi:hypothetical protein